MITRISGMILGAALISGLSVAAVPAQQPVTPPSAAPAPQPAKVPTDSVIARGEYLARR